MNQLQRIILYLLVLIAGAAWIALSADTGAATNEATSAPQAGFTAPDFTLETLSGETYTLSSLQGNVVLVNFWATWCPPCRAEMPELLQAARDYPDLALLAVNVAETSDKVSQFAEQFRMDVPVVIDPQGAISDRYNVRGLPTSIFLDADGKIMEVRPGAINRAVIDSVLQR